MNKLTINDYLLQKSKIITTTINSSNTYKREMLEMIQRTIGPLEIIINQIQSIPETIYAPLSILDISYDPTSLQYVISTECVMIESCIRKRVKCNLYIPGHIFDLNNISDIEAYYTEQNTSDIRSILITIKAELQESLQRIEPLINMLSDNASISKIGGE